jgi:plasmid stabilization system protein ParE
MRVRWTDNALRHLLDIYEYISQNSPFYAQRMVDRLPKRSEQIADFPMSGNQQGHILNINFCVMLSRIKIGTAPFYFAITQSRPSTIFRTYGAGTDYTQSKKDISRKGARAAQALR